MTASATKEKPAPSTGLIAIDKITPAILFAPEGVDKILAKIEKEVRSVHTDITTKAGREALASTAYKIARSKTTMDDMGKALVADWKAKSSAVDADRRKLRDRMDALKDEVRKPLTDFEEAEKARVEGHDAAIAEILELVIFDDDEPSTEAIRERILALSGREPRDWQEFEQRGEAAVSSAENRLSAMLATAEKREADRAELEKLRTATAERDRKDREAQIAALAAKADAQAVIDKAQAELAQAEADKIAATAQAETDRQEAVVAERERIEAEQKAEQIAAAEREANKAHAKKINNEVLAALVAEGIGQDIGKKIVIAIASGKIPHAKISY